MRSPRVGSLFSGIGGFDLGLERAGMQVVWQCESNPYCRKVLKKHWPDVPCYPDIRTLKGDQVEWVEVLCGGFPCQDLSFAGKGEGITGPHSGLWSAYHRIISEVRPTYVLVENVPGLLHRGLDKVLGDLAASGYDCEWDGLPASAFGAPHERDRVWIVAYPASAGLSGRDEPEATRATLRVSTSEGSPGGGWWDVEPGVRRVVDGVPNRVDRIRSLGNALVPQIAEWIGNRIIEYEQSV